MAKLSSIAYYVTDKISSNDISLAEYVTTDCILQNKKGREVATNLPPQPCSLIRYQRGDVLIANIRPYLKKVWFADIDGGASPDVLVFRAKDGHSPSFLYAILLQDSFFDYVMQGTKGSKMPRGDKEQILRYEMPTFSCSEESIGTFFLNLDRKIHLNERINQNLEAMIADVMDYKFLSNVGKLPKRRIGDIALIKAGGDCPQEWSKYKTKDYQIPIYSNGTDNEGLYGYTKEPVILKRSVTVAARGTIGYCEIREGGYVPIIRLLAVTPNDIGGDVYLHQVFNRIKFKNDGSIQQQLTVPSIASIEIPYPDASALKTFANITYPFIEKIKLNKIQIEELTKQRDKLLPLLMNGQVSVNSDLAVSYIIYGLKYQNYEREHHSGDSCENAA